MSFTETTKVPSWANCRIYSCSLEELHAVLQKYPTIVKVDGYPLINFERYVKFMDRIKEVVHYKPPSRSTIDSTVIVNT